MKNREGISLVLGTIYRHHYSPKENSDRICDLLKMTKDFARDKQLLVCGDFNFGYVSWEDNRFENKSKGHCQAMNFFQTMQTFSFTLTTDSRHKEHASTRSTLNYHKADFDRMRDLFCQFDWEEAFSNKLVKEKWNVFIENYNEL